MSNAIAINLPLSADTAASLSAGQQVLLNGPCYTLRDASINRLVKILEDARIGIGSADSMSFLDEQFIFFAGPTPPHPNAPNLPFGSIGPTTAKRMDTAQVKLMNLRSGSFTMTMGKGARSDEYKQAAIQHKAVYFAATGGAAALLAQHVVTSTVVAWPDLGPEAIMRLELRNFPAIVATDSMGNDLYQKGMCSLNRHVQSSASSATQTTQQVDAQPLQVVQIPEPPTELPVQQAAQQPIEFQPPAVQPAQQPAESQQQPAVQPETPTAVPSQSAPNTTGALITFEGGEGAGKSTQIALLEEYLTAAGHEVLTVREPGSSTISEDIRNILLDAKNDQLTDRAELLLYLAARAQLTEEVIKPALQAGKIVLCDRFFDSTTAYQGYARGLDIAEIRHLNIYATDNIAPNLTIVLDLAPEAGLARAKQATEAPDRIEGETLAFHQKVRDGFLAIAKHEPHRVFVYDATEDANVIAHAVAEKVQKILDSTI